MSLSKLLKHRTESIQTYSVSRLVTYYFEKEVNKEKKLVKNLLKKLQLIIYYLVFWLLSKGLFNN